MTRLLLTAAGSPAAQNFLACLRMTGEALYIVGSDANPYHLEWGQLDRAYTSPLTSDPCYLPWLNDLIKREGIEFVHGQADWEVAFLSRHAEELGARTLYPHPDVVEKAQNKLVALSIWHEAGLRADAPRSVSAASWDVGLPEEWGPYPIWIRATRGAGARGSCLARTPNEALYWLAFWHEKAPDVDFMAEAYLPGREFAWQGLFHRGELVCSAARERLEFVFPQHAPSGVTSSPVVARSVRDWRVDEIGEKAVRALDEHPHGVYGVDMKEDAEGILRPTECNAGRFFTTSLFLASAGLNMPWYFARLGLGDLGALLAARQCRIPEGLLWIRHIDCGQVLTREADLRAEPLEVLA